MLRKALQKRADHHDERSEHDRPPPPETLGEPRSDRDAKNRAELIARVDETKKTGLDIGLPVIVDVAIAEVFEE